MKRWLPAAIVAAACAAVSGQAQETTTFEVASIKPASPAARSIECGGGPGTASPGIWRCTNVPLVFVIGRAYDLQPPAFSLRDSCCQARFDFVAKVPEGTNGQRFKHMLQNLLVERFQLALHHEQKEMAVFELAVGSLKMKESAPYAALAAEDPWAPPEYTMGKDGYPVFRAGHGGLAGGDGHYRWTASQVSMQEIVKTLAYHLGRPVIDATGLRGKYDIDLTWTIDTAWLAELAGQRDQIPEGADNAPRGPTLIHAVRDQLGLLLISKKGSGDIVMVDHVAKVPVEN